jgi:hypothetical protein
MYCTRKALISVKGMSEQKIDKIIDAGKIINKLIFLDQKFFYKIFLIKI